MTTFNPYYVDEIVTQTERKYNYFGLLLGTAKATEEELHGYEVTMSGKLVLPELHLQKEDKKQQEAFVTTW